MPKITHLGIGSVCKKGHKILSEADVTSFTQKYAHRPPQTRNRCRKCKREGRKTPPNKPRDLLSVGACPYGHTIQGQDDVIIAGRGDKNRCRKCASQQGTRRFAVMECSHSVLFSMPWPLVGDLIYCRRCREYRKVQAYGGEIEDEAPSSRHMEDGL